MAGEWPHHKRHGIVTEENEARVGAELLQLIHWDGFDNYIRLFEFGTDVCKAKFLVEEVFGIGAFIVLLAGTQVLVECRLVAKGINLVLSELRDRVDRASDWEVRA
jgi:hypothetical protein